MKRTARRIDLMTAIVVLVFCLFVARLAWLQLVMGEEYSLKAQGAVTYNFKVDAVRGRIFDRNGIELASTGLSYNIELNNLMLGDTDLNETIRSILVLLDEQDDVWTDTLPISIPQDGEPYEILDPQENAELIARLKADLNLQQYATADQIMMQLVARYELENYSPLWQRYLAGVRRQMELDGFSESMNYILARDISTRSLAQVREHGLEGNGAEVLDSTVRTYPNGALAGSILGSMGPISQQQWLANDRELAKKGYLMDDLIGQSGIEALYETQLRGERGTLSITRIADGTVVERALSQETVPGLSPVLTLDNTIQDQINRLLEAHIKRLQATKAAGAGRECSAGAVVVLNARTGGILAACNYPTFDLSDYRERYSEYLNAPGNPLFNRVFQGTYAPGSAFKPTVALAGLLSGVTDENETVNCTGNYHFYSDYQPGCLQISHSGPIALRDALKYSCNIYFYDLGRRVGLDRVGTLARKLGLGTNTGLELPEAKGWVTSVSDQNYSSGLVLQASIGQGNTAFTPVQLATYANTLANKGVRYRTHILEGWYNEQTGEYDGPAQPMVEDIIVDNIGAFDLVEEGMVEMSTTLAALRELPLTIACKTGSPQRAETYSGGHYTNSVLIAYGPVPDPEIAVAIVLEYGGGGANAAPLLADILELCMPEYWQ